MKHVVSDFFHKLFLCIAIFAIFFGAMLSIVKALLPWLPQHKQIIEQYISNELQQSVRIQHIGIGWTHMQAFLQLQGVTIQDQAMHQASVLSLPEIDVQLNLLQSLWKQHLQFSHVTLKNAQLTLYQDTHEQWHLAGSENLTDQTSSPDALIKRLSWLLSIHHWQLESFKLNVKPKLWPAFALTHASIDTINTAWRHQLFAQALVDGPTKTPIQFAVSVNGKWQDFPHLNADFYLGATHFTPGPWLAKHSWHNWQWQQGSLDSQVWASWHIDHWQQGHMRVHGTAWRLNRHDLSDPLLLQSNKIDLSGSWQAILPQWQWQLKSEQGRIGIGHLFKTAIPFNTLQAQVNYSQDTHHNLLTIPFLSLKTPDLTAKAVLNLDVPTTGSPLILLNASVNINNLNHAPLYLPIGIMPPNLVQWLTASIKTPLGATSTGTAQMLLRGPLQSFPFHDHTGLMDIRGQLHGLKLNYAPGWPDIDDLDLDCQFTQTGMHLTSTRGLHGGLPIQALDVSLPHYANPALLHIQATTQADLHQAMAFIRQSPLKKPLAALATSTSHGPFKTNLTLDIPLSGPGSIRWQGDVDIDQGYIGWPDYPIEIDALQGKILFSNDTVSSQHLKAKLWGSLVDLNVYKKPQEPQLYIDGHSLLAIDQLPSAWPVSFLTGRSLYHFHLALADRSTQAQSQFWVTSLLQGLTINLPLGLNKTASEPTPVQLHGTLDNQGHLKNIDSQWRNLQDTIHATYHVKPDNQQWQITSALLGATITISPSLPWDITIQHLQWPTSTNTTAAEPLRLNPATLPAMNIRFEQAQFATQALAHGTIQLRPTLHGSEINQLDFINDLYQVNAKGIWTDHQSQLNGTLSTDYLARVLQNFALPVFVVADHSQLTFNLAWPGAPWQVSFRALTGQLSASLTRGSLPDVGTHNAATMGFGKILNLLSINSLPQHLSFNFNDLSAKGFSFDRLEGDFTLQQGQLKVSKLTVNSGIADIKSHGCVDINQQQYQLVMQVKPHVTSSLPIIAAIAGGPIIGVASLLANTLISPTLNQITSSHYLLTGLWANPVNQKYSSAQEADAALKC